MSKPKLRERVELIIRDQNGRVLVGMNPRRGSYQFPGGGIDGGSVNAAAKREAEEEAGVAVAKVRSVGRPPDIHLSKDIKPGYDGTKTYWRTADFAGTSTDQLGADNDAMLNLKFYDVPKAIKLLTPKPNAPDMISPQRLAILKGFIEKKAFVDELTKLAKASLFTDEEEFEKSLQPGDVIMTSLAPPKGIAGTGFRIASNIIQGDRGHSFLYAGNGKAYDTRFEQGAKLLPLEEAIKGRDASALRPKVSEDKKLRALKRAESMVGAPYHGEFGTFFKMALSKKIPMLQQPPADIRKGLLCSRMITRAYGNSSFGLRRSPELITPGEFMKAPGLAHVSELRNPNRHDRR